MKNEIPTTSVKPVIDKSNYFHHETAPSNPAADLDGQASLWSIQQRYAGIALTLAVIIGGLLFIVGQRPFGKGLILGTLFSIINFILMALALPMRMRYVRARAMLFSITSIYARYALMALPLIWALKHPSFAVSTTAVGLFMVQLAIMGDHLWARLCNVTR